MMQSALTHLYVAGISLKGETGLPDSTQNVSDALGNIVELLVYIIGALAIIFIIVGGLQIVTAAGSPTRVKQGRETIIYAIVGLVVAIAAYAAVTFIGTRLS